MLTVQIHDHTCTPDVPSGSGVTVLLSELEAYRDAGYDWCLLGGYSGKPALPDSLRRRPTTVDIDPGDLAALAPLQLISGGEEVGDQHVTSAGSATYIELGADYTVTQGCIEAVQADGGFACVAHPYGARYLYDGLGGYDGIEIASAYAVQHGVSAIMRQQADEIMTLGLARPWVVAVNDHYGPAKAGTYPDAADSGYCVVLADEDTEAGVVAALQRGSFYAVADLGTPRHVWPASVSCSHAGGVLTASATGGTTVWLVDGEARPAGETLDLATVPVSARFARAEITVGDVTIYCQPYYLRRP